MSHCGQYILVWITLLKIQAHKCMHTQAHTRKYIIYTLSYYHIYIIFTLCFHCMCKINEQLNYVILKKLICVNENIYLCECWCHSSFFPLNLFNVHFWNLTKYFFFFSILLNISKYVNSLSLLSGHCLSM